MPDGTQLEVYSPDGVRGTIPSAQAVQAMAQGYKPADAYIEAIEPKSGQTGIIPKEQWEAAQAQGYVMSPRMQARAQTRATSMQPDTNLSGYNPTPYAGQQTADVQRAYANANPTITKAGAELTAGAVGGAAVEGVGMLPTALRMLGAGAGGTVGNVVGSAMSGQKPSASEAATVGGSYAVGQGLGEAIPAAVSGLGKQVSKIFRASPTEVAEIAANTDAEARMANRIVHAEDSSRTAFKNAADAMGIDSAPTNMAAVKNLARAADQKISGSAVPRVLSRVADIPEPPRNVLTSDDVGQTLRELSGFDNVPFRQAQMYQTAIERFIGNARGKLPSDVYAQLKGVSSAIGDSLQTTAEREGKGVEYQTFKAMFKQHAQDFWNPDAPLGDALDASKSYVATRGANQPAPVGTLLKEFKDPTKAAQAIGVLQRRGIYADDLVNLVRGGKGATQKTIDDMAAMNLSKTATGGPDIYNAQVGAARKAAVKKLALGAAGTATVGSGLMELIKRLATKRPQ